MCEFLKNEIPEDSVIVSAPSTKYLALCERKNILCFPFGETAMMFNISNEYRDLVSMYYQPSKRIKEQYNISFLVLCGSERKFFGKYIGIEIFNFTKFPVIYKNENCEVIEMQTHLLQQNYNESLIHKILLKKAHYRIWFEEPQKSIMRKILSKIFRSTT